MINEEEAPFSEVIGVGWAFDLPLADCKQALLIMLLLFQPLI